MASYCCICYTSRLCCGCITALLQRAVRLCEAFLLAFCWAFFLDFFGQEECARARRPALRFFKLYFYFGPKERARGARACSAGFSFLFSFLFLLLLSSFGQEELVRGAREGLFCEESSDALRLRLVLKYLTCDWY